MDTHRANAHLDWTHGISESLPEWRMLLVLSGSGLAALGGVCLVLADALSSTPIIYSAIPAALCFALFALSVFSLKSGHSKSTAGLDVFGGLFALALLFATLSVAYHIYGGFANFTIRSSQALFVATAVFGTLVIPISLRAWTVLAWTWSVLLILVGLLALFALSIPPVCSPVC